MLDAGWHLLHGGEERRGLPRWRAMPGSPAPATNRSLGVLHEARAQVALISGDALRARVHLAQVKRWLLPTQNPVLIARCERLQREVGSGNLGTSARDSHVELRGAPVAAVDPTTSSRGALARKASG